MKKFVGITFASSTGKHWANVVWYRNILVRAGGRARSPAAYTNLPAPCLHKVPLYAGIILVIYSTIGNIETTRGEGVCVRVCHVFTSLVTVPNFHSSELCMWVSRCVRHMSHLLCVCGCAHLRIPPPHPTASISYSEFVTRRWKNDKLDEI